jgi:cell division protein FtsB
MTEERSSISSVWLLIALVIGILIVGDLTRRMTDSRRMEREAQELAMAVEALEAENAELEQMISTALDDSNVASWARSEAKLVLDGERLVVPLPAEDALRDSEAKAPIAVEPPSPWEVWWALLVGG